MRKMPSIVAELGDCARTPVLTSAIVERPLFYTAPHRLCMCPQITFHCGAFFKCNHCFLEVELDPPMCVSAPVARKRKATMHATVLLGKWIETSRAKQERHGLSTKIYYPHERILHSRKFCKSGSGWRAKLDRQARSLAGRCAHASNVAAYSPQLFDNAFIAAIDVINALDSSLSIGHKSR
jgi:hypothetical protein